MKIGDIIHIEGKPYKVCGTSSRHQLGCYLCGLGRKCLEECSGKGMYLKLMEASNE